MFLMFFYLYDLFMIVYDFVFEFFYVLFIFEKFSKDFRNDYLTLLVPSFNLGSKIFFS